MSVGTLSSQQLRSLVEDKWQRDEDALAVGLHVHELVERPQRGGVRLRQGPSRAGRHGVPSA